MQFKEIPREYGALFAMFPVRPLHDRADLENKTEIVDAMAGHALSKDQEDYLDILSDQVMRYEEEHHPIRSIRLTVLDRLRFLLEESGTSTADLGRLLGNRGLASLIVNGKRNLSKAHIRTLAEHFRIEPGYLL